MKRAVPFGVMRNGMISNRTRGSCLAISDGNADGNSVQKCGISNQPVTASAMIRVFPSLEHSTDYVRKPTDNFRTFVCPLRHQTTDGIYAIFMSNKT